MKIKLFSLLAVYTILSGCVILSGCAGVGEPIYPEKAADGADWNENWLMHGSVLGIEDTDGFTLLENYAVLTMSGITTSVWGVGAPETFINENGEEEENWYQAQIYVLVKECANEEDARNAIEEWTARLEESWSVTDAWEAEQNGQTYALRDCTSKSAGGQYSRELAAFAAYGAAAVCVELDCRETFDGDANAILSAFLDGCHYNAALQ